MGGALRWRILKRVDRSIRSLAFEGELKDAERVDFAIHPNGKFFVRIYPTHSNESDRIRVYGAEGGLEQTLEVPRTRRSPKRVDHSCETLSALNALLPPLLLAAAWVLPITLFQGNGNDTPLQHITAGLAAPLSFAILTSAILGLLGILLWVRYVGMRHPSRSGWLVTAILAGPCAWVLFFLLEPGQGAQRCTHCGARRALNDLTCSRCGENAAPPARDGTEIFASEGD